MIRSHIDSNMLLTIFFDLCDEEISRVKRTDS